MIAGARTMHAAIPFSRRRMGRTAGFALAGLLAIAPAAAQFDSNSDEPIEISSDTMEWLQDAKIAIARGNADAVQGRYHLHADKLTAHLIGDQNGSASDSEKSGAGGSAGKISHIEAEGNVVLTTPDEMARGEQGTYDVKKRIATLTGSVVLIQGDNVIRGQHLIMDLDTGRSTLVGAMPPSGGDAPAAPPGRVRALFAPDGTEAPSGAEDNADDGPDAGPSGGTER